MLPMLNCESTRDGGTDVFRCNWRTNDEPRQAEDVIAVSVGDEYSFHLAQFQSGLHKLVLGALTAVEEPQRTVKT